MWPTTAASPWLASVISVPVTALMTGLAPSPMATLRVEGDFISVTVGQGEARPGADCLRPLIQRLVRGEDVVTVLIQRQREDVLAVDGAADAVAADGDDHGLAAAGEPCRPGWLASNAMLTRGSAPAVMARSPVRVWGRAPVAVLHQVRETGVDLGQHAVGDMNIEGAKVVLVPVVGACTCKPQVDAVGADRLIQHAVEHHLVPAIQPQGHGQNGLAARIQQGVMTLPLTR